MMLACVILKNHLKINLEKKPEAKKLSTKKVVKIA